MASALTLADRVVEFYTLRRLASAQEKLGAARGEIAELTELGRQRASAAEALFAVGHTVEALRLAFESLDATREAAGRLGEACGVPRRALGAAAKAPGASPPPSAADAGASASAETPDAEAPSEQEDAPDAPALEPWWLAALRATGPSPTTLEATEATVTRAEGTELPRLETGVTPAHSALFRDVMRARAALEGALAPAMLSRSEIRFSRGWRPLVTAVLVLGVAYGAVRAATPVEGTFTRASATWADSPDFQAEHAIDGNDATMWILPDGQNGFLEVRFVPGRRIERITLVNAGNAGVLDRGTNEYDVEMWVEGAVERSISGAFADEPGDTATYEVGVDEVDRIRFVVRSHHRLSGGLSELRWE